MKKYLFLIIVICLSHIATSQLTELHTNGYLLKFKKIGTLFFSEYPLTSPVKVNSRKNDFNNVDLKYSFGTISKTKSINSQNIPSFTTNFYVYEDGTLQAPTSQIFLKPINANTFIKNYSNVGKIEEHTVFNGYYYLYVTNEKYMTGEGIFELCEKLYTENTATIVEPVFTTSHLKSRKNVNSGFKVL